MPYIELDHCVGATLHLNAACTVTARGAAEVDGREMSLFERDAEQHSVHWLHQSLGGEKVGESLSRDVWSTFNVLETPSP